MSYQNSRVAEVADTLKKRLDELDDKTAIVRAVELKALYAEIPTLPPEERAAFGAEVNALRSELEELAAATDNRQQTTDNPIDVTAPFDTNTPADKRTAAIDRQPRQPASADD